MRHIPNILTLLNLVFGCLAIVFILNAPTYLHTQTGEEYFPLIGLQQIYYGSLFIFLAALMDVLDGLAARLLNAESPIGKDLDSLADIVSFGVAPSMILYKFIWFSYMSEPGAMDTPIIVIVPAFLIACFGALRLARFNQTSTGQKQYFIGMPIPAVGIFVASLPLIKWYPGLINLDIILQNRWIIYMIAILLSYFMVSNIKFLKWKSTGKGLSAWWPQLILALTFLIGFIFLKFAIVPIVFIMYILLSIVYPHEKNNSEQMKGVNI